MEAAAAAAAGREGNMIANIKSLAESDSRRMAAEEGEEKHQERHAPPMRNKEASVLPTHALLYRDARALCLLALLTW